MMVRVLTAGVVLVWTLSAAATAQDQSAHELVRETTERVMDVVVAAHDYVDENPERYYDKVQGILDPLIDYRGFARGVMGPYASSRRYRALDEEGRAQLRDQLDRFTTVMRKSLVRTYSKGLLAFGESRIEVLPPEESEDNSTRASVRQHVYADRSKPYVVFYQMGRDKSEEWKLRNVIIENVNLGDIYRDQFQAAARDERGDLDKVIANWTTVEVDVDS